jgi:aldehyde:ferredoxin oxidoreductase
MAEGAAKGQVVELEPMLKEYYAERGLDEDGKPKESKLRELGLDFAVKFIKS